MRNPKQDGSRLYDCVPQSGPCPMRCNQCYFNRGYYRETPFVDDVPDDAIVRMNCGHDSNIKRDLVIDTAKQYRNVFFNTSIPRFDFPSPVVFTANPDEEILARLPLHLIDIKNIMYIRLRVSNTNLGLIDEAVKAWYMVPIVLTFIAYYDYCPERIIACNSRSDTAETKNYEWKVRHVNSYWCAKEKFINSVIGRYWNKPNVFVCEKWCRDCRLCERFYLEFMQRSN